MEPQQFPFSAGEDWIIQGGTVGDQITMKVWRPESQNLPNRNILHRSCSSRELACLELPMPILSLMTEVVSLRGTLVVAIGLSWPLGKYLAWAMHPDDYGHTRAAWKSPVCWAAW